MEQIHINFLAVFIAVVANFFFGFIWYTPLFGKAWAKESGLDMTQKPKPGEMMRGMIINVIGSFFLAFVFAHNIAAWSFVPAMKNNGVIANALMAGIFTWLGFFLPVDLNGIAWERKSWKLFFINSGYHLISVVIMAVILTLMP